MPSVVETVNDAKTSRLGDNQCAGIMEPDHPNQYYEARTIRNIDTVKKPRKLKLIGVKPAKDFMNWSTSEMQSGCFSQELSLGEEDQNENYR